VVEGHARQSFDRLPGGVLRHGWVDVAGDEAEVGGRELSLAGRGAPSFRLIASSSSIQSGAAAAANRLFPSRLHWRWGRGERARVTVPFEG
jgi:hypothetical protein